MALRSVMKLAALLCVVALVLAAPGALADPLDDLDDVSRRLEEAREGLEDVDGRRQVTIEDLAVIDARRAELDARLAVLGAELAEAEAVLAAAEEQLAATTRELTDTEALLVATGEELDEAREVFSGRARASFKHQGLGYIGAVLSVRDASELGRGMKYVQVVLAADRVQMERVGALEREVEAHAGALARLQARQDEERVVAQGERDHVAAIVAEQEEVRAAVVAEAQRHRVVLAQLESQKETYEQLVASLEAESAALEAELRRIQEEERRRAEEARLVEERRVAGGPSQGGSGTAAPSTGQLQWPANGRVTSGYGWRTHPIFDTRRFHAGIDIGAPSGSAVYAAESGTVFSAGWRGGYGNTIVVDHGGGLSTLYAHLSGFSVSTGQRVSRGQIIGAVGCTGYCTGPHLHFEVRVYGEPRDPMDYL